MNSIRALVVVAALALAACGPAKFPMTAGSETPAAEGMVKVSDGDNGNSRIVLSIEHLAPPQKVTPGATTYVAWVAGPGAAPQNVGALTVAEDLSAKLETVTPLKSFEVFVTPEASSTPLSPSGPRVLSGSVH